MDNLCSMGQSAPATVYLGLGSNLDNPPTQVRAAISLLDADPHIQVIQSSPFYSTKPVGPQDQPDFCNAVIKILTTYAPLELLDSLQQLEQRQGRVKKRHWGERVIDIDILLYDNLEFSSDRLTIPHKELIHRDFVLKPLMDIAPTLSLPSGALLRNLLANLPDSRLTIQCP